MIDMRFRDAWPRFAVEHDRTFEFTVRKAVSRADAGIQSSAATRVWRTRQDSNLWPLPSEGSALSS